jgi:hypothetical protein
MSRRLRIGRFDDCVPRELNLLNYLTDMERKIHVDFSVGEESQEITVRVDRDLSDDSMDALTRGYASSQFMYVMGPKQYLRHIIHKPNAHGRASKETRLRSSRAQIELIRSGYLKPIHPFVLMALHLKQTRGTVGPLNVGSGTNCFFVREYVSVSIYNRSLGRWAMSVVPVPNTGVVEQLFSEV